jgi:RNA polymerase sigma factor (sigma-70 family)
VNTDPNVDSQLFEAWQKGDRLAGQRLFERHFESVYRFFENKVYGDVSDLVQRTFVGCIEAAPRFRGASSFRTFLFAIARNELYGHYRNKKRDEKLDFGVSSAVDLSPGLSSMARKVTERAALGEAIRSLPLDLQVTLELHYWEGLSGPEMAEILDVPEGTVRSRLRRGLERLRDGVLSSPVAGLFPQLGEDLDSWAGKLRDARSGGEQPAD